MTRRRKRRRRYLVPLWIGAVLAGGIGWNVSVALRQESVQAYVREALEGILANPFEIGRVEIGLEDGADITDFRILTKDGKATIAHVDRIRIVPRVGSLLSGDFEPERVELFNLDIQLSRDKSGRFNIQDILRPLPPSDPEDRGNLPDIIVSGCSVRYVDESRSFTERIENLEFSLTREEERVYSFRGGLDQSLADRLLVSGRLLFTGAHPSVDLRVRAFKLDVTRSLARLLPDDVVESLRDLELAGSVDIDGDLSIGTLEGVVVKRLGGRLIRCSLSPEGSPFRVTSLGGEFFVRERTLEFRDLTGRVGGGILGGHCFFEFGDDGDSIKGWGGKLSLDGAPFDRDWVQKLSPEFRDRIKPFEFSGTASGAIEVAAAREFPPRLSDIAASLEFEGVDLRHKDFPASVTAIRGKVKLERGELRIEGRLTARCLGGVLSVTRARIDLNGSGELDVHMRVGSETPGEDGASQGIVLDERLREALPDQFVDLWDQFELRGRVDARIRLRRERRSGSLSEPQELPIRTVVHFFPRDVRIAYRDFPYEVKGLVGEVVFDSRDGLVRINHLTGHHDEQTITGSGIVDLRNDALFEVVVICEDLPCSPDLLAAVGEGSREIVDEFGFEGRMKTVVKIFSLPNGEVDFKATLDLLEGALKSKEFDYPLTLAAGQMVVHGERVVEFKGVRTAEDASPSVRFDGSLMTRGDERTLNYDFDIARLSVDQRLRTALPEQLREFVENFGLEGTFDGRLAGHYKMNAFDPSKNTTYYRGSEITTSDAAVDFGIKIKDMKAKGLFVGGHALGQPNRFWGEVFVESAWFNRLNLTNGDILFRFGEPHRDVLADRAGQEIEGREYRIPVAFLDRLEKEKVRDTFQMSVHSGSLYGGSVDGFLYVDTGDLGDLGGHFSASGLQVARAAKDVFGVEGRDVNGIASGNVQFVGSTGDIESLVGEGVGVIEKAQLLELPLFLGLLGILKLDIRQARERKFFNEVRLPFRISGGRFHTRGTTIKSPAISLTGSGTMSFAGELDLTLRPQVVDTPVPIWDQLVGLVKDALVRVMVKGDLADPNVTVVTALGLIDIPIDTSSSESSKRRLPSDLEE